MGAIKAVVTMTRGALSELLARASQRVRPPAPIEEELSSQPVLPHPAVRLSPIAQQMIESEPQLEDEDEIKPLRGSLAWRRGEKR